MAGARRCLQWRNHRTAPVFEPSLVKVPTPYSMASVETFAGIRLESQGGSVGRHPENVRIFRAGSSLTSAPVGFRDHHPSS
jgi:hypothetical protein